MNECIYDKKSFWRNLLILVLMIPLQRYTRGNGFLLVLPFALASLVRKRSDKMFFWIMLSIALMMGNNFLMPKGLFFYLGQRFLFATIGVAGGVTIFARKQCPQITPLLLMLVYVIYAFIPSLQGWSPIVSVLKLVLFLIVFLAYFGMSNMVAMDVRVDMRKFRSVVLAFAVFFIVGSLFLLPFPAIGQLSGEEYEEAILNGRQVVSLFKGMSMHSQALGPVITFIIVLLFADMCFNVKRNNRLYDILIMIGLFVVYKTSSRAAMASLILGLVFVGWEMMRARGIGSRWKSRVISMFMGAFTFGLMLVIAIPSFRDGVARFALKYNADAKMSDVSLEEMTSTRQSLIDESLFYWREKPIIGNGFQVSAKMQYLDTGNWKSLLSAPIEKGVWVTAVLEEGGVVGLALVVMFVVVAGFMLLNRRAYIGLAMLFAIFISNMAEFTMFSMSAMGGLIWAFTFMGCALDAVRIRVENSSGFMPSMGMPPPYPPPPYAF